MKQFLSIEFDPIACRKQLSDLKELLRRKSLSELDDILPFFRERQQLSLFISSYNANIIRRDRIAFEYDIFGDFRSDLVVGDSVNNSYCFVEFEDATANSIFVSNSGASQFCHYTNCTVRNAAIPGGFRFYYRQGWRRYKAKLRCSL